jgi:phage shock protein C
MNRRLYRCRENRMIAGVAGGVAEYFSIDPSIVRLLWVASIFFGGLGILLYIAMIFIVPLEPLTAEAAAAHAARGTAPGAGLEHLHRQGSGWLMTTFGVILLIIGAIALLDVAIPGWATWRQLWPLALLGAGGFLVVTAMRRQGQPAGPAFAVPSGAAPAMATATTDSRPIETAPSVDETTPTDDEATSA